MGTIKRKGIPAAYESIATAPADSNVSICEPAGGQSAVISGFDRVHHSTNNIPAVSPTLQKTRQSPPPDIPLQPAQSFGPLLSQLQRLRILIDLRLIERVVDNSRRNAFRSKLAGDQAASPRSVLLPIFYPVGCELLIIDIAEFAHTLHCSVDRMIAESIASQSSSKFQRGPRSMRQEPDRVDLGAAYFINGFQLADIVVGQDLPDTKVPFGDGNSRQPQSKLTINKQAHPLGISHLIPDLGYPSGMAGCFVHGTSMPASL